MNVHDSTICDLSIVVVGPFVENISQRTDRNVEKDAISSEHLATESVVENNCI